MAIMCDVVLRLPHNLTEDGALRSASAAGSRAAGARNILQRPLSLPMPLNGCPPTRRVDRFQATCNGSYLRRRKRTLRSVRALGLVRVGGAVAACNTCGSGSGPPRRATSLPCRDPVHNPAPHGRNAVGSSERHHRKQGNGGTDRAGRRSTLRDIKQLGPRRFFP